MFYRIIIVLLVLYSISNGETFKEILKESLENSFLIKQKYYQLKALDGKILSAEATNNPEISVEFGRIYSQTDSGIALTALSIQQQLRLWGEKKYAKEAAVFNIKSQEFLFKSFKNNFTGELYKKFYEGLYKKEIIEAKKQELKLLKQLYSFVKKSYELGESVLLDVLQIEKEIHVVSTQLENLKADYRSYLNELSVYTGRKIKSIEGDFYSLKDIKEIKVDTLPSIVFLTYMEKSLDNQIKRQKALAKPQFSIGLTAEEDPVDLGKYEFGISVSSKIPLFYKNQGEILTFINQKKSVMYQKKQVLSEVETRIKNIKNQYYVLLKQIDKIKKETIRKIKKALDLAEKSYRLGAISFFEYSSVRRQYFETIIFKNQLVNKAHQLYGDYLKITGIKGGIK